MPVFIYKARRRTGEKVEGELEARDRRAAMLELERTGLIPASVEERSAAAGRVGKARRDGRRFTWRRSPKLSMREVLVLTTELSDLLASGMTLGNALNSLARRAAGKTGDSILTALRDDVVGGVSLSDALAQHPKTFSNLYVNMIRAGEASGAMHEVLLRIVTHYERMQELKEKITMALVYPIIVLVLGAATLVFSMVKVVPKFKNIFDQMGKNLPLPTQILIGMSDFVSRYGLFVGIGLVIAAVMANRFVKTQAGQLWWHRVLLRTPLLRGIVASAIYANFARTLGTLLANGVPVLSALAIVEQTVGNAVISREIHNARDRVTDGTTISGPLAAGKVFPPLMIDMLSIGEQTGDMVGALTHIARRYENDLDRNVKIFTTALEPMLIVVVALLVGFVAVSILMAVFSLTNAMGV